MRRKTNTQFKREIKNLVGDEYTFLDKYVNSGTKLKVKHNKCGHVYKVDPSHFLRGKRCPYCYGNARKTNSQFKQEVFDLVGNEYVFLDNYISARTKIRVKHNRCNHIYLVKPNNFLNGQRCPYCSSNTGKTDKQFKQEVYDLVGTEYTVLGIYRNARTRIKVKHNKCDSIYKVEPNSFLRGSRCPYCYGNIKKTNEQFKQQVYDLVGDEYTVLGTYINTDSKIKIKHNECNNIYKVRPSSFLDGSRCPYCNSSKGESITSKILDAFHVSYESQKTFDDLRDKECLSYDFYISDQNILIEYQGIQHYEPVKHFGGKTRFRIQRKHDKLKLKYAKTNHYNLIAIPYTEDTFSKIKKYLINHGLVL